MVRAWPKCLNKPFLTYSPENSFLWEVYLLLARERFLKTQIHTTSLTQNICLQKRRMYSSAISLPDLLILFEFLFFLSALRQNRMHFCLVHAKQHQISHPGRLLLWSPLWTTGGGCFRLHCPHHRPKQKSDSCANCIDISSHSFFFIFGTLTYQGCWWSASCKRSHTYTVPKDEKTTEGAKTNVETYIFRNVELFFLWSKPTTLFRRLGAGTEVQSGREADRTREICKIKILCSNNSSRNVQLATRFSRYFSLFPPGALSMHSWFSFFETLKTILWRKELSFRWWMVMKHWWWFCSWSLAMMRYTWQ